MTVLPQVLVLLSGTGSDGPTHQAPDDDVLARVVSLKRLDSAERRAVELQHAVADLLVDEWSDEFEVRTTGCIADFEFRVKAHDGNGVSDPSETIRVEPMRRQTLETAEARVAPGKARMRLVLGAVEGCWTGPQSASTLCFTHQIASGGSKESIPALENKSQHSGGLKTPPKTRQK